jgi:hypothetical protein
MLELGKEEAMTETMNCKCGNLLYFGEIISRRLYMRAVPSEEAVLESYGNVCPRCGSTLALPEVKVNVKERNKHGS